MPLPSPGHYYAFDETSGTATAADTGSSTAVALSSVSGTPVAGAAKHNDGRTFAASPASSLTQGASASSLVLGAGVDFTLSFWLKCDGSALAGGSNVVAIGKTAWHINISPASGVTFTLLNQFNSDPGPVLFLVGVSGSIFDNTFHHICITFDSATLDAVGYFDGTSNSTGTASSGGQVAADVAGNLLAIGNDPFSIDELAVFSSSVGAGGCLTSSQASQLYNSGAGNFWDGTSWSASGGSGGVLPWFRGPDMSGGFQTLGL